MTGLLAQVPGKLLGIAVFGVALLAALTVFLSWHALRRVFDVPRVPRPPAMYVALGAVWLALATACAGAIGAIVLLRDYRDVDYPTDLAEVRCAAVDQGRMRLDLRAASPAGPESYQIEGDVCVVWVKQVELRPGLRRLGIHALSRVEGVGALVRPAANPYWLTPQPQGAGRLVNLMVRDTKTVAVPIPIGAPTRVVLMSSPTGPTLRQGPS